MTSLRSAAALTLLTAAVASAAAQTPSSGSTTTARRPTTHRAGTSATHASTPVADPADNPPGVPKVTGAPKPLFTLRYVDIVVGTGEIVQPRRFFTVNYTGWLTDGTKFDSSYDHGAPITFPYGARRVIAGWDTGFEGMHVGGKRRLYIPYELAYGESGQPPVIPPKANLIFDVELVGISETPPAPPEARRPPTEPTPPAGSSTAPSGGTTAQPPTDPTRPTATPPPAGSSNPNSTNPNPPAR